jgi:hypothetical protein
LLSIVSHFLDHAIKLGLECIYVRLCVGGNCPFSCFGLQRVDFELKLVFFSFHFCRSNKT